MEGDALRPWAGCRELGEVIPASDDGREDLRRVRLVPGGAVVNLYFAGSGREASASDTTLRLTRGRCEAIGVSVEGGKESLLGGVTTLRFANAPKPTLAEIADLAGAVVVSSADGADLAAARMLLQLERHERAPSAPPPGGGTSETAWPAQPEHPGKPRGAPDSLWAPAALAMAGVPHPSRTTENGEPFDGIRVWRVRQPRRLATRGRWQLWEVRFRARLGGGVLAVYDRRTNRHRWAWASEYDYGRGSRDSVAQGESHFDILSFEGDLLLLRNRRDEHDVLWAIDVARGVAREIQVGTEIRLAKGGVVVTDESGERRMLKRSELRP